MNRRKALVAGGLVVMVITLPLLLGASSQPTVIVQSKEMQFLNMVRAYLDFGETYAEFCTNNEAVAVTAAMTIKDLFDKKDLSEAKPVLEKLLKETRSQAVRNALHMALKEVYEESGQHEQAVNQLVTLIGENDK